MEPGEDPEPTDEKNGHLTVTKTTTSTAPEGGYGLGDIIEYTITVTNDGNVTISDIRLTDTIEGYDPEDITANLDKTTLVPGDTATATFTHTVTDQDVQAGSVRNNATVDGSDPDGDTPENVPGTTDDPVNTNITLVIQKVWADAGNIGMRPATLNMILNGGTTAQIVTLTAANNWVAEVTVPRFNANGTEITYTWTEPAIVGYTQTQIATTGNMTTITNTLNTAPAPATYQLTVNYRFLDGTQAANTIMRNYTAGAAYNIASPAIEGYRAIPAYVTGTMPANNLTITVLYLPNGLQIIEDYETPLGLGQAFINIGDCIE